MPMGVKFKEHMMLHYHWNTLYPVAPAQTITSKYTANAVMLLLGQLMQGTAYSFNRYFDVIAEVGF